MKQYTKRIFAGILTSALSVGILAGCGSTDSTGSAGSASGTSGASDSVEITNVSNEPKREL